MAKIYPKTSSSTTFSSTSRSRCLTSSKETFTIWMKSLVFNGNGCAVYDSQGQLVYRMDNYDHKHSNQVHLMDLKGNLIFTILRKKFSLFGCWEAYKYNNGLDLEAGKPWFRVKKACPFLKRNTPCKVTVSCDNMVDCSTYRIEGSSGKVACKIVNQEGEVVAEVLQKQSASGITLGQDVMKLVVEPNVDHSLVMGLVIVYSLMNSRM